MNMATGGSTSTLGMRDDLTRRVSRRLLGPDDANNCTAANRRRPALSWPANSQKTAVSGPDMYRLGQKGNA